MSFEVNEDEHQHVLTIIIFFFLLMFLFSNIRTNTFAETMSKEMIQNDHRSKGDGGYFIVGAFFDKIKQLDRLDDVGRNEAMAD